MTVKHAYIETFGCQMNERDSEIMTQLLSRDYSLANDLESADLVVVNTCSIREKAEQKAFSLLGRLRRMKREKPHLLIAVAGCLAQQQKGSIRQRMPHVDVVVGPQQIYRLPDLLADALDKSQTATTLSPAFSIPAFLPDIVPDGSCKRFVTIMQGCNNFCTYCVVPYTRGREISRPIADILAEAEHLARHGIKELTLLGQNVNSFGNDRQETKTGHSFPLLLEAVATVDGIERIRFTTSHPKDLSEELAICFTSIYKLCPHIHLPVQSGSNKILERMNRKYTVEEYLEKINLLHKYRPDIAISTDLIVGFPGETKEDFTKTMELMETVRYHSSFSFKYSDRPQAKASRFDDKIDEGVKSRRLAILQKRQEEITIERNREMIGKQFPVMLEGDRKNACGQWTGRTGTNHIVNFTSKRPLQAGQFVEVVIEEACLHSLRGTVA